MSYEDIREKVVPTSESLSRMHDIKGGGEVAKAAGTSLSVILSREVSGRDEKSEESRDVHSRGALLRGSGMGPKAADENNLLNP